MRQRSSNPQPHPQRKQQDIDATKKTKQPARRRRPKPPQQESPLELVKDFCAIFVITVCVGSWLILLWKLKSRLPIGLRRAKLINVRSTLFEGADILDPTAELKLPTPIIVVGLPKSGTTSIAAYFRCGRIASSHFSCEVGENDWDTETASWRNCRLPKGAGGAITDAGQFPLCSICVERNILYGRPPLEGCGPYKVWAELDSAEHPMSLPSVKEDTAQDKQLRPVVSSQKDTREDVDPSAIQPLCSYPQIMHLDEIHAAYPNATFILNTRPVDRWINSISKWNGDDERSEQGYLRQVLTKCNLPGFASGVGGTDEEMRIFHEGHSKRIRDFVEQHPSLSLVEVDIEEENAGTIMEERFGIIHQCWKKHNPSSQASTQEEDLSLSTGSSDSEDAPIGWKNVAAADGTHFDKNKASEEDPNAKEPSPTKAWPKEVMEKLHEEKPNTRLVLEYPQCVGIEDIFPLRSDAKDSIEVKVFR